MTSATLPDPHRRRRGSADEGALRHPARPRLRDARDFPPPRQALELLRESPFDLLLTDLMMPEMDGISLLRGALQRDPNLIGIIMTGQGTISTAVEAMKTGAFDYMLKPFKLSIILPVLARALAMRRLRLRNAELELRVRERTAELEAANRELEAFSFSVSHDLRAPCATSAAIRRFCFESLRAGVSEEAAGNSVSKVICSRTERMGQLIEGLLQFSRLGRQSLTKSPVSTVALVREVWDGLARDAAGRQVEFVLGPLPDCHGDLMLLRQVFVNLLSNAFKFTRQSGAGADRGRLPDGSGGDDLFRPGQRGRLRHEIRREAFRRLPASACRRPVRGHRRRPFARAAHHPAPRRPDLGRGGPGPGARRSPFTPRPPGEHG